jgi:hypothetical protein
VLNLAELPKTTALVRLLDDMLPGDHLVLFELGRLRCPYDSDHREGDGWSTYQFCAHPRVAKVYSVDTDARTRDHALHAIPPQFHHKLVMFDDINEMPTDVPLDFLYLDGPDDGKVHLVALEKLKSQLRTGLFAVDDYMYHKKSAAIEATYGKHAIAVYADSVVFRLGT